jgi:23S rRNA pseudouridine1911/1915/1917 synthase
MYKIIKETKDYLVIEKEAGVIVHPGSGIEDLTLIEEIAKKYPKIKKVGDDPLRPGIVHRLDREASGLMVIALNQKSFLDLKKQFQDREIVKEYKVLVYGQIEKEKGTIDFPIKRAASGHKMAAMPKSNGDNYKNPRARGNMIASLDAREAISSFKVEKKFINYTLLKVNIKTGRTHQIRVHMFAYGHPVVGDSLYCTKKTTAKNKKLNLNRIFLVAQKLEFTDLKGEKQSIGIDLPPDLSEFLSKIK